MNEETAFKIKKFLFLTIAAIIGLVLITVVYYMIAMSGIPAEDGDLGNIEEVIVLPERPGTRSLILTGPIIIPLKFTIDMSRPNISALDWSALRNIDVTADVKIRANVSEDGSLFFDPISDVYCPGHTKAGEMISKKMQTWAYIPYQVGEILFHFNVGAIGTKLTIDVSKLQRREGVDPDIPIRPGVLYLIENGLGSNDVKTISW